MILVLIFDRIENNATNPDKTFITLLLKRKLSKAKATESLVCLWQNTFSSNVQEKKGNTTSKRIFRIFRV